MTVLGAHAGVTLVQHRLLTNASLAEGPESITSLNDGAGIGTRDREVSLVPLVRAGFLLEVPGGRGSRYVITPAGREFAEYLRRLEVARE